MLKKLFAVLVVLYPILSAYIVYDPVDLGVLLCSLVGILLLTSKRVGRIAIPKGYLAFLLYIGFTSLVITHAIPARVILYSFLFVLGCTFCELEDLYKYYKNLAIICIVFFVVQEASRITTGIVIPGIFTFLPTLYGDSASYIDSVIVESERSASFFLEPSYFAQFLFPLLVLELYRNKGEKDMRNALLLSLVIILIRSGNGYFLLALIWGLWFIKSNTRKRTKILVSVVGGVSLLFFVVYKTETFTDVLARTSELTLRGAENKWQTSGFVRFFRGYYLYGILPRINQLFGTNPFELQNYMMSNSVVSFETNSSFLNGVQTILCLYGLIGLIFFVHYLVVSGKKSSLACVSMLICVSFLLLSESYFICGRMLVTMIMITLMKNKNENIISDEHIPKGR